MHQDKQRFIQNIPWSLWWVLPNSVKGFIAFWVYPELLVLGWIWPFMFSAGAIFFTNFDGSNPLLWRSFSDQNANMQSLHSLASWNGYSNHHFLNLAIEGGTSFLFAGYFLKIEGTARLRAYWKYGILATYATILIWATHEGLWWVFYIISSIFSIVPKAWTPFPLEAKQFSGFGELLTFSILVLTPVLGLYVPKRFLLVSVGFYLLWWAVGFPITESYGGNTELYPDSLTNLWEVGSWAFFAIAFYVLERKGIYLWFLRIKGITLNYEKYLKPTT